MPSRPTSDKNEIPGFEIRDIILQVNGNFNSNK
jgi:hypothetical protein